MVDIDCAIENEAKSVKVGLRTGPDIENVSEVSHRRVPAETTYYVAIDGGVVMKSMSIAEMQKIANASPNPQTKFEGTVGTTPEQDQRKVSPSRSAASYSADD